MSLVLKAVVETRSEVASLLDAPGDAVVIRRGIPRWMILRCPCGCGEDIPINLDARAGKAWRFYDDPRHGVTLYPSVWRDTGCESHFIVWRGEIWLFGRHETWLESSDSKATLTARAARVLENWPEAGFAAASDMADVLSDTPWDVIDACRQLCREGKMVEGKGGSRGTFARLSTS